MANYFDEEGGDSKSCTKKKVDVEKEQIIIKDGRVKTKFRVKVVEKRWGMYLFKTSFLYVWKITSET